MKDGLSPTAPVGSQSISYGPLIVGNGKKEGASRPGGNGKGGLMDSPRGEAGIYNLGKGFYRQEANTSCELSAQTNIDSGGSRKCNTGQKSR